MKTIAPLLIVLAACSAAPPPAPAPAPQPQHETPASALVDRLGDSAETAVTVPADAPDEGIRFENDWIYDRIGRFRRTSSGTGTLNGRRYEVIEVETPTGAKQKFFFDITENWNNWRPPQ